MKKLFMVAVVLVYGFIQAKAADKESPTDQKFIVKAVECTIAEAKLVGTALKRAANPEVKQRAQHLSYDVRRIEKLFKDHNGENIFYS
jgi:predicted outer membrane protein